MSNIFVVQYSNGLEHEQLETDVVAVFDSEKEIRAYAEREGFVPYNGILICGFYREYKSGHRDLLFVSPVKINEPIVACLEELE
ncbi:hypothetical protein CPT_Moonbeam200 [Bacillus phage Moonbeam]|uniref:Uncharacterized protein n=1 Tax=Bacillus phage Moonbeam TaxID=1540091 RepID=A0A0A0RVB3_9CAUD|nr:hypothetical protein CPT_Moonbeam200 [Bacillus phage Moonbeam]AIW03598.1 hypothetical protein CPT_Moonbeam200 [Bacillus phage Moonbeam]